jgi:UDP-3-O-[3-hydroxymyristoyl] glucosamine N-acyltransferase
MKAKDVIDFIGSDVIEFTGNETLELNDVVSVKDSFHADFPFSITWVNDATATDLMEKKIHVGLFLISPDSKMKIKNEFGVTIVCHHPRKSFQKILAKWFSIRKEPKMESTAIIDKSVVIGVDCYIGHHVVIEKNCIVGDRCEVLHNTVLLEGTIVGSNVRIGANCTIGNYGFGYEKDTDGNHQLIEHLGHVVIHDDVEIHNNTCIDRAVLGNTIIGRNVKIDNLVHIAHGVHLDENSLVIAHAMVAGSVVVGKNSWISPGALIKNKIIIGKDALVGLGAVVVKNVLNDETVIGNPAESMESFKEWSLIRKKLKGK